jgi:hypothetical protein
MKEKKKKERGHRQTDQKRETMLPCRWSEAREDKNKMRGLRTFSKLKKDWGCEEGS